MYIMHRKLICFDPPPPPPPPIQQKTKNQLAINDASCCQPRDKNGPTTVSRHGETGFQAHVLYLIIGRLLKAKLPSVASWINDSFNLTVTQQCTFPYRSCCVQSLRRLAEVGESHIIIIILLLYFTVCPYCAHNCSEGFVQPLFLVVVFLAARR